MSDKIAAARRLAAFLRDEDVQELMGEIEDGIAREWQSASSTPAREALWHEQAALSRLRRRIQITIDRYAEKK